jgi:hypothetical protein
MTTEQLPQWIIDMLEKAQDSVFETLVEQMKTNPDAIEALYSD